MEYITVFAGQISMLIYYCKSQAEFWNVLSFPARLPDHLIYFLVMLFAGPAQGYYTVIFREIPLCTPISAYFHLCLAKGRLHRQGFPSKDRAVHGDPPNPDGRRLLKDNLFHALHIFFRTGR